MEVFQANWEIERKLWKVDWRAHWGGSVYLILIWNHFLTRFVETILWERNHLEWFLCSGGGEFAGRFYEAEYESDFHTCQSFEWHEKIGINNVNVNALMVMLVVPSTNEDDYHNLVYDVKSCDDDNDEDGNNCHRWLPHNGRKGENWFNQRSFGIWCCC